MAKNGFTLIELVMVMILASILAIVAYPVLFKGTTTISTGAMARKLKDDIRYAQSLAVSRYKLDTPVVTNPGFRYRMRFNVADTNCPGTNHYTIVSDADNNGTWGENPNSSGIVESARNPANGSAYFCIQLDTGDYAGFTVSTNFGNTLEFDVYGVPYDINSIKFTAAKTITLSKSGETSTIVITPNTGMVSIQ